MEKVRVSYTIPVHKVRQITQELLEACQADTYAVNSDLGDILDSYEEKDLNIVNDRLGDMMDALSLTFDQMGDIKNLITGYQKHLTEQDDIQLPDDGEGLIDAENL